MLNASMLDSHSCLLVNEDVKTLRVTSGIRQYTREMASDVSLQRHSARKTRCLGLLVHTETHRKTNSDHTRCESNTDCLNCIKSQCGCFHLDVSGINIIYFNLLWE